MNNVTLRQLTYCTTLKLLIMAIVSSMWLKGAKKRLGGTVIYQAMGQTRQRELAAEVSNPRTESQMGQRVKWANLVNLYRANRSWMKYAYETRKANQSEYNKFMSLNVASSRIYLTKEVANAGGCVVDEYLMTQGSLPSIEFVPTDNGYFASNIVITDNVLLPAATVASFSQNVIANNPAIREGDQLSFIRMTQMTNASTGVPYVVVREYEVIINPNNNAPLWDYFPSGYFYVFGDTVKYLAVGSAYGKAGGFCMVLSRTISGKTYVSSQRVILVGMDNYIGAWSNSTALQAAIDSYGVSDNAFLSSTFASRDNQAPTLLALLSVKDSVNDENMPGGSRYVINGLAPGDRFTALFNSDVPLDPSSFRVITNQGEIRLTNVTKAGLSASGEVPDTWVSSNGLAIMQIVVVVDSLTYTLGFIVANEDTIQGIE